MDIQTRKDEPGPLGMRRDPLRPKTFWYLDSIIFSLLPVLSSGWTPLPTGPWPYPIPLGPG